MSHMNTAVLARVVKSGLGYLVDEGSNQVFPFTFDKIPNYRGESATDFGISAGRTVTYDLDQFGHVKEVRLTGPKKKSWFSSW